MAYNTTPQGTRQQDYGDTEMPKPIADDARKLLHKEMAEKLHRGLLAWVRIKFDAFIAAHGRPAMTGEELVKWLDSPEGRQAVTRTTAKSPAMKAARQRRRKE